MVPAEHKKILNATEDEIKKFTQELNVTEDEIKTFTQAFRDEKFRELLFDYARELLDPDKKKSYEEDIKQLEQGRGNNVHFIHVEPCRVLRTSLNGSQKCFINICSSKEIAKPTFKRGVTEDGRRGQHWSLTHSLVPGRQERDQKGNKFTIYDVVFHPDSIHLANKDKRFRSMVDDTAIRGIQDAFKVTLDANNMRELSIKYKGSPHPSIIRKPISGFTSKGPPTQPDTLAFPQPEKNPATTESTEAPIAKSNNDTKAQNVHIQPQTTKEQTTPTYTLKYRSFVDLQDFRCPGDSTQSSMPKEIVVTVDVPLLRSARDANLEIKTRTLLLESSKPAYRLELPLAYSVDEDKGSAKFSRQKGQLTITLPVLPSTEALHVCKDDKDVEEFEAEVSGVEEKECQQDEDEGKGKQHEILERIVRECELADLAAQFKDACGAVYQGDSTAHPTGLSSEDGIAVDNRHISALCHEEYSESNAHVKTSEINGKKNDENQVIEEHEGIVENKEKEGKMCVQAAQYKDASGTLCHGDGAVHHIGPSAEEGLSVEYERIPNPCNDNYCHSESNADVKTPEVDEKKNEDKVIEQHEGIVESKEKDGKMCVQAAQYKDAYGTVCYDNDSVRIGPEEGLSVDYERIPSPCNDNYCYSESNAHVTTSEINDESVVTAENDHSNGKMNTSETKASLMKQIPSGTKQMALAVSPLVTDHSSQNKGGSMSPGTEDGADFTAEGNEIDEDDLPVEKDLPSLNCHSKSPPALLRETKNEDREENATNTHSTRITFQNDLLYELD